MTVSQGTRVEHYEVGDPLGSGGMSTVYRAVDTRLGRTVALKFLQGRSDDAEHRSRLMREARAASALSSPNIASIYDIGEHDGALFLVMEFVDGEPLSARIARGPVPIPEALDIAAQVADALDDAHAHSIVHRDIKSANLMIDPRGRVKVLDFGLAKFLETATGLDGATVSRVMDTVAGTVLGTFSYMSPEQARGRIVDGRTDLFSLGVVLYEMVTGRLPFEGATVTEVLDRILNHEPLALARFNYGVPQPLEGIVRKALAKDPAFRYQSAREMFIDLHTLRRDLLGADASGLSRTFAVGSGTGLGSASRDSSVSGLPAPVKLERAVAVMTFTNITREPADDWIGQGIAETVTSDLKNVKTLSVIGRAQVFEVLKNLDASASEEFDQGLAIRVGRQLGASWIVGGGYQKRGDLIRITAQFVDVATGELLRTVKVDGRVEQIFELQDKIVYELGQGLNLTLGDSDIEAIAQDETQSVDAYEAFSRGMMNLRMATRESMERAVTQFEKAIAHDARYAKAWAALGATLSLKGQSQSLPELSLRGVEALRKAVEIAPSLAQAHYLLGSAYNAVDMQEEALTAIRTAIKLEPDNAGAHAALARVHWFGRGEFDDGIRELEHATRLNPDGGYAFLQLSLLYALRGSYKRAEAAARRAIELQEQYVSGTEGLQIVGAHMRLGYVLYRQGRYDEAIREYERELAFLTSGEHALRDRTLIEVNQKLSAAYWRKGDHEEADRYFDRAVASFKDRLGHGADDGATKYYIASLYGLRGDAERAARYLAESFRQLKALNLARARIDPDFDPVRDVPDVARLLA